MAAGYLRAGKPRRKRRQRRQRSPGPRAELDRKQLQGMLMGPLVYAKRQAYAAACRGQLRS